MASAGSRVSSGKADSQNSIASWSSACSCSARKRWGMLSPAMFTRFGSPIVGACMAIESRRSTSRFRLPQLVAHDGGLLEALRVLLQPRHASFVLEQSVDLLLVVGQPAECGLLDHAAVGRGEDLVGDPGRSLLVPAQHLRHGIGPQAPPLGRRQAASEAAEVLGVLPARRCRSASRKSHSANASRSCAKPVLKLNHFNCTPPAETVDDVHQDVRARARHPPGPSPPPDACSCRAP